MNKLLTTLIDSKNVKLNMNHHMSTLIDIPSNQTIETCNTTELLPHVNELVTAGILREITSSYNWGQSFIKT